MGDSTKMNGLQGTAPVSDKKNWKKPVLDIFELERAEGGTGRTYDGHLKHTSA
jgi:hypothetical protein